MKGGREGGGREERVTVCMCKLSFNSSIEQQLW